MTLRNGACTNTPTSTFFVKGRAQEQVAKSICNGCGVKSECLEYALAEDIPFGIFGGLAPRERNQIKRIKSFVQ
jgi:WhiB family redox-sensing transcriptional regulator